MQLPTAVNIADNLKKDYGFVNIDEGNYKAVIVASGTMPSITQGQPDDYFVKVIITEGQFKDTVFDVRLGFLNHNPCNPSKSADFTWAMAAAKTIASIADAVGLAGAVTDTVQVHNKPFLIEVKNKPSTFIDKNTGASVAGKPNSRIYAYHKLPAVGGFGAPAFAAQNAPQVVAQATAPSPFVQPAAVASPPSQAPWAR